MKIVTPPDFFSTLRGKHLLLDTNVFIDALIAPVQFGRFFDQLKDNETTLVTLDIVLLEFTRGAQDAKIFKEKKEFVEQIIELYLHEDRKIFSNALKLVEIYKEEGKGVQIPDLILGATLMYYQKSGLCLLTKNPTDFPTTIFPLETYMNLLHTRAIQSYGVYSFKKEKEEEVPEDEVPF